MFERWTARQRAIALVGGCSVRLSQAAIELFQRFGNHRSSITYLIEATEVTEDTEKRIGI